MKRRVHDSQPVNRTGFLTRFARPFARDTRGATAIEFALIATPFFLMMMGIIEAMLIFFGNLAVEDALDLVGREIKTGQITSANNAMTPEEFKTEVCSKLTLLRNCSDNLVVAVQSYTQFSGAVCANAPDPDDASPVMPFDTGSAGSTIVACAFYKWQITTPLIGNLLSNLSGNRRWLQSTIMFKNEPFATS